MTLREQLRNHFDRIEKVSFGLIALGLVLSGLVLPKLYFLVFLGSFMLWSVYFALSQPSYFSRFVLGLLIFFPFYFLFEVFDWEGGWLLLYLGYVAYVIFGVWVLGRAIKDSLRNKNFEMLMFLTGVFIALGPVAKLLKLEELEPFKLYYDFGIAFLLATILYNDNLWDRFNWNQKSIIKYLFMLALLSVFNISLNSFLT